MNHQILLLTVLLSPALTAQVSQEELKARKVEKLAQAWVKNADWLFDYGEAKKKAAETGKPIFTYFTRSYAP